MKRILFFAILLAAVSAASSGHAATDGTIGVVRNSAGSATVTRGGNVLPATAGTRLHTGDTLGTGPDGSLGVILRDDSSLSIGPSSKLVLRDFFSRPPRGSSACWFAFPRGPWRTSRASSGSWLRRKPVSKPRRPPSGSGGPTSP